MESSRQSGFSQEIDSVESIPEALKDLKFGLWLISHSVEEGRDHCKC